MSVEKQIKSGLKATKGKLWKTQQELAESAGLNQSQMSRFLNEGKEKTIYASNLFKLLDSVGAKIIFPGVDAGFYNEVICQEAAAVNRTILKMRAENEPEEVVKVAALKRLELEFNKNDKIDNDEQTSLAS